MRLPIERPPLPHLEAWFARLTERPGLALDANGFVRVTDTLQTVTDPSLFAAGDVASMDGYRLEKAGDSWKIYDVNVLGIWLVNQYKNSFGQEIKAGGIDGLIAKLAERNKAAGK